MTMRTSWIKLAVAMILVVTLLSVEAGACPTCAENLPSAADAEANRAAGLPDNPSGASSPQLAEGFYYSILFMLAIPYTLVTAGGVMIYFKLRKNGLAEQAAAAQPRA